MSSKTHIWTKEEIIRQARSSHKGFLIRRMDGKLVDFSERVAAKFMEDDGGYSVTETEHEVIVQEKPNRSHATRPGI